jgi:hypothetical protein
LAPSVLPTKPKKTMHATGASSIVSTAYTDIILGNGHIAFCLGYMSVSNSWIIYKKDQLKNNILSKKILLLRAFKTTLEYLIDTCTVSISAEVNDGSDLDENIPHGRGRHTAPCPIKKETRAGGRPVIGDKQSRCRQCHYKKSLIHCSTCNVFLCLTS